MGSYMFYVLMEAVATLGFAYAAGVLAMEKRRLPIVLVALGVYLIMAATLAEAWGEHAGWEPGGLGIHLALMAIGVAAIGSGSLARETGELEVGKAVRAAPWVLLGTATALGLVLMALAGSMDAVVDPQSARAADLSGGFSHLEPAGWVLAAPMLVGAVVIVAAGARTTLVRGDGRGLWLWGAGILFLLWPFDLRLGELPLTPALVIFAVAMAYFGYQEPKAKKDRRGEPAPEAPGPLQTAMDDWVEPDEGARDEEGPEGTPVDGPSHPEEEG